jgi:hypothetical protein
VAATGSSSNGGGGSSGGVATAGGSSVGDSRRSGGASVPAASQHDAVAKTKAAVVSPTGSGTPASDGDFGIGSDDEDDGTPRGRAAPESPAVTVDAAAAARKQAALVAHEVNGLPRDSEWDFDKWSAHSLVGGRGPPLRSCCEALPW